MPNSNFPAPQNALEGSVYKPSLTPIPADRRKVIVGGGICPKLSCTVKDIPVVLAAGLFLFGGCFYIKEAIKDRFKKKDGNNGKNQENQPEPPKIQPLVECVSSSEGPKPVIIPGLLYQGGIGIVAGRTGIGKSLLLGQFAVEIGRGFGEFIPPTADGSTSPRSVIIIDGEMEDDDYAVRFPDPTTIPGNITRVSECDFETSKQLTDCVRGIVSGLMNEVVIIIDNIASLIKNPTASDIFDMYRELRKIQCETSVPVSFLVGNHLAKVPEGISIDETNLAGSANITRFASSIAILDKSARGADYRFLKIKKERKNGAPEDVIELEYTEEEYKHYKFFGTISEDEVLYTKTNRKRFGQEVVEDGEEPAADPNPSEAADDGRGHKWSDKDTEIMKLYMSNREELDPDELSGVIGCDVQTIKRRAKELGYGDKIKKGQRGRPKQKPSENQDPEE